eukprot:CAMPEP_0174252620 /NCGR_PEP_ID=MMETSP0439-20130205/2013_1 /TAXON_ID=0 /ORGANISM="Stereomyxa ramosa, Strain Chinc5" /LENGTH=451 /DNA_ID=CAMNT_0015333183 /DNA_START=311 /DNA_END=1666 /DNA_ORIENTATION=+
MAIFTDTGLQGFLDSAVTPDGETIDVLFGGSHLDGTPIFFCTNPEDFRALLDTNIFPKQALAYESIKFVLGEGLVTSEGKLWKRQRRLITPIFHFQKLKAMVPIINSNTIKWIEEIKRANEGKGLIKAKIFEPFSNLTLHIIVDAAFGGDMNADDLVPIWKKMTGAFNFYFLGLMLWGAFINDLLFFLPWNHAIAEGRKTLADQTYALIAEKQAKFQGQEPEEVKPSNLLDALVMAKDPETGESMPDELILDETLTILFAGHDTTSNLMSWTVYQLTRNPEVLENLRKEVSEVLGDRLPEHEDIRKLKYCSSVLKETLRLNPPVPMLDREAAVDHTFANGVKIPKGCYATPFFHAAQTNKNYFRDPLKFIPERWLDKETKHNLHPYCFSPFSQGARNCVGQRLAMLEATIILSQIVKHFDFNCDLEEPVHMKFEGTMTPKNFHCDFIPRDV